MLIRPSHAKPLLMQGNDIASWLLHTVTIDLKPLRVIDGGTQSIGFRQPS